MQPANCQARNQASHREDKYRPLDQDPNFPLSLRRPTICELLFLINCLVLFLFLLFIPGMRRGLRSAQGLGIRRAWQPFIDRWAAVICGDGSRRKRLLNKSRLGLGDRATADKGLGSGRSGWLLGTGRRLCDLRGKASSSTWRFEFISAFILREIFKRFHL